MPTASERIRALREARSDRGLLNADEATAALEGQTITSVEFCDTDPELGSGYVVIRVGQLTLYADDPSVYTAR